MIWGKSPERRVVMPAGAFKFLRNDITSAPGQISSKSRRYRREVLQKVKKTSRESVRRGRKHRKNHQNLPIWRSAAVPPGTLKGGRLWSNFIEKTIIIAEKSFKNAGGVSLVKFHLKTKGFSREVPQKVEKTSHESVGREREHCKLQLILKKWNSSPD